MKCAPYTSKCTSLFDVSHSKLLYWYDTIMTYRLYLTVAMSEVRLCRLTQCGV